VRRWEASERETKGFCLLEDHPPRTPDRISLASRKVAGRAGAHSARRADCDKADIDGNGSLPPLTRVQQNLLAAPERRILNWLCAVMPEKIMPDHLTIVGFFGTIMIFLSYIASENEPYWFLVAIGGYAINWFGDSLDGSLARYRHTERPKFGYFTDHSLDAVGNLLTMVGLGCTAFVRMDVALLAASCYLLLSVHTFLAARVLGTFRLSYGLIGPTELRLILIGLTIAMFLLDPSVPRLGGHSAFDLFATFVSAALFVIFAKQTFVLARSLHQSEGGLQ
jgi:archaetidylinositol phosphate synthase